MKKHTPPLPADLVRKLDEQGRANHPSTKITDQTVIDARFDAVTVVGARFDDITVVAAAENVTQPRLDNLDGLDDSEAPIESDATMLARLARLARRPRVPPPRHAWPPAWVVVLTVLFFFAAGAIYWQMHLLIKACSP
ncbi:MAG: hypothetical protein FWD73_04895 [Polyangiaceae bacterium]|nr:hypothetical protein [Polyangiaceae bacterium]